jgi:hypothetical protein
MYQPMNGFAKVGFVMVFSVEGGAYIYWPIDNFARDEFVEVFCQFLQELNLLECFELKELPTSIGQLMTLQKLNLLGFSKLK